MPCNKHPAQTKLKINKDASSMKAGIFACFAFCCISSTYNSAWHIGCVLCILAEGLKGHFYLLSLLNSHLASLWAKVHSASGSCWNPVEPYSSVQDTTSTWFPAEVGWASHTSLTALSLSLRKEQELQPGEERECKLEATCDSSLGPRKKHL